jgi:hypothetical protein
VTALNQALCWGFDRLLRPLAHLPPLAGLALVSLPTAVAMLLVFRATSNQARLAAVKRSIHAVFFEIRLFSDDVPALFRAEAEMLRHTWTYVRLSLVPMLWMIVPLTIVVVQLDSFFAHRGLTPGTHALVTATLRDGAPAGPSPDDAASRATLDAPPSIRIDTPAVSFPHSNEVVWRITPMRSGSYMLRVRVGERAYDKTLEVSDNVVRRSPARTAAGFWEQLLNPSEPPLLESDTVAGIAVDYPSRDIRVLGWDVHWLVAYVALSMLFAFVLRRPFGVVL